MFTKTVALSILLAYAEARFGQEQATVSSIQALNNFGNPGDAGTLSGQVPGVLLAGANSCAKLQLADTIVATLGNDPSVISAAKELVHAEKNTNPFAVDIPSLCSDAGLPATAELRGIIPLIDPATGGSDIQNANADASLANPFDNAGLSVADISLAQGFGNFTLQGSDGSVGVPGDAPAVEVDAGAEAEEEVAEEVVEAAPPVVCGGAAPVADVADEVDNGDAQDEQDNAGDDDLDFGLCIPTMDFQGGRNGRPADEFTFLPTDALVGEGQQEALNPGIIINRICDQLTNVCEANDAAKAKCEDIQAEIAADGNPKVAETADRFNAALGF